MKLKKPAKDHRGSWDLVLDNEGTTVAAVRLSSLAATSKTDLTAVILWPAPSRLVLGTYWTTRYTTAEEAVAFFKELGVDTAPLEKLIAEKGL